MLRASRAAPFACSARASSKRCGTSSVLACEAVGGAANASKPAKLGVPKRQPNTISGATRRPAHLAQATAPKRTGEASTESTCARYAVPASMTDVEMASGPTNRAQQVVFSLFHSPRSAVQLRDQVTSPMHTTPSLAVSATNGFGIFVYAVYSGPRTRAFRIVMRSIQ